MTVIRFIGEMFLKEYITVVRYCDRTVNVIHRNFTSTSVKNLLYFQNEEQIKKTNLSDNTKLWDSLKKPRFVPIMVAIPYDMMYLKLNLWCVR